MNSKASHPPKSACIQSPWHHIL